MRTRATRTRATAEARPSGSHTFTYAELVEILAALEAEPPRAVEPTLSDDEIDLLFG